MDSKALQSELASIQNFILRLQEDIQSAGFNPNKVVTDGVFRSSKLLEIAIDDMACEHFQRSVLNSKIAWIHAFFARSVLDSDMTEQYLGDQNFLELKGESPDWEKFVEQELGELEEEIIKVRNEIKEESGIERSFD